MTHPVARRTLAGAILALATGTAQAEPTRLSFAGLYGQATAAGIALAPAAAAAVGRRVRLEGFMAPPLKAESDFFVLTRFPMSVCPFCSSSADWPVDIVLVQLGRAAETLEPSYAIEVTGTLEQGMKVDPATGFVSLVRLTDATWRRV